MFRRTSHHLIRILAMETAQHWKKFFCTWSKDILPRGILVSTQQEQIPFKGFMLSDTMVLLERTNPCPLGSRFIFMPYEYIAAVKLTDPLGTDVFKAAGYVGKMSR